MSIRDLPDFLKSGDPTLTFPHGKTYGVNHPKGVPNLPGPITAEELARDWLRHVAAGRIGGGYAAIRSSIRSNSLKNSKQS